MSAKWMVTARLASDESRVKSYIVHGHHNGHILADATDADDSIFGRLRNGSGFDVSIAVDVSGAGGAQVMRLRVSAAAAINVNAVRVDQTRF